ncbi:MAG: DUF5009 domain-containing protein [Capnocytophaga sp.]|nr:DUF5009 domain-containing protein [Capnocytophaga sp.]
MEKKVNNRLLSLDILRGITIAGMILVNNPGSWNYVYTPLGHASWNGLTPTDLIFPFFMLIMGVSTFIALRKFNFEPSKPLLRKIIKRTLIIFLIGIALSWFAVSLRTYHSLAEENLGFLERWAKAITNFEKIRILGVMQRLALSYGITSLIVIFVKHKYIPYIIATILVGYIFLLHLGNGYATEGYNLLAVTDQNILGLNHMYVEYGVDPEGILSTIPCIAHVLIGFYIGKILVEKKDNDQRMLQLFIIGTVFTFLGLLLSYGFPINKKIWTSTFVLTSCGMGILFLALLIYIIDVKGHKKWTPFFETFGVNPLFIYVLAGVIAITLGGIRFDYGGEIVSAKGYFYSQVLQPLFGDYVGSLVFALLFVGLLWSVGYILYKKRIYIKL